LFNWSSANAVAGVCEYLFKRYSHRDYDVSRLFIYYNGQIISQRTHRVHDYGVSQKDVILGIRKYGLCQEKLWPYDQNLINTEPSKKVYRQASHYTIVPLRIPCNIKAIETCLHHQIPVLLDIILLNNIGSFIQANHGYLPIPDLNNSIIDKTDLHTVLLVGYNRNKNYFIVRNSWGGNWVNIFFILF
jgi:C1A family cysteine protease